MNGDLAAEKLSSSTFRADIEEVSRQGSSSVEAWERATEPSPINTSCLPDTTRENKYQSNTTMSSAK